MDSLKEITKQRYGVPNNKGWSPFCDEVPESIRSFKWTNEYVEQLLRKKINERGLSSKDLLQQAYFLFGRPKHGLTLAAFGKVLKEKLGLPVSQDQCLQLFRKYDVSGDGKIDFYEFIQVPPPPLSKTSSTFMHHCTKCECASLPLNMCLVLLLVTRKSCQRTTQSTPPFRIGNMVKRMDFLTKRATRNFEAWETT